MLNNLQSDFSPIPRHEDSSSEYESIDRIENEERRTHLSDLITYIYEKRKWISKFYGNNPDEEIKEDLLTELYDITQNKKDYQNALFERTKFYFSLLEDPIKQEIFLLYPHLKSLMEVNLDFFNGTSEDIESPQSMRNLDKLKILPEKVKIFNSKDIKRYKKEKNSDDESSQQFYVRSSEHPDLSDIKAIEDIKEEIQEVIDMIKDPESFQKSGAKLIRGILLMGNPGTGKTLLARALATESKSNFIYCSGSDFDKPLVGQGNSVVKELFEQAKKNQPCIIFIDEIDSLLHKGRRSGKYTSSNDRSLINTFLSEMDGFSKREKIFVLGATNSEKDLDPAAIRPGRFDKLITVHLPDTKGREELLECYLKKVRLIFDARLNYL